MRLNLNLVETVCAKCKRNLSYFAGEDPTLQKNFQRKWNTTKCADESEALEACISFIYTRWNNENPSKKFDPFFG